MRGEVILAVESGNLFESGSMRAEEDHARVAEAAGRPVRGEVVAGLPGNARGC